MRLGLGCLILAVAPLVLGLSQAEAAYRLTFQNGTSVEVQSYEDLGDAIRYPRLGGVVVVPKSSVSAIEEAVHLPPPTPPAPAPQASSKPASKKTCPKCGVEMVLRTAQRGAHAGDRFWGCSQFPRCRVTEPV